MKLLHKQLLAVATPFLALIVGVLLLHAWWIEPMVIRRFHRETMRELNQRAVQIRSNVERAKSQLRQFAESPVFRTGSQEEIVGELRRLESEGRFFFMTVGYCDDKFKLLAADGSTDTLRYSTIAEDLAAGSEAVTEVRFSRVTGKPVFLVLIPLKNDEAPASGFVVGELPVVDVVGDISSANAESDTLQFFQVGAANQFLTAENVATATKSADLAWPFQNDLPRSRLWGSSPYLTMAELRADSRMGDNVGIPSLNVNLFQLTPRHEVLGPIRRLRTFAVGVAALGMICSLAWVWRRNRTETSRLETLTELLQRFGAGNDTVRSADQTSDEIGRLASAFNCMVEDQLHSRRKLQKQLAEHAEIADGRKDRTAELQTQVDELGRYASAVAHDVRAPLVTLQGFVAGLETAARNGDWDRFHGDVERIQRISGALQQMSQTLLEFARLGGGRAETEAVSLYQAATEAVELLRGPTDQAAVAVVISPQLPTVQGDPIHWRQVFQNLIDNSVRACAGVSGGRIEIGCEERIAPGKNREAQLCCFVRDNGAGLNSDQVNKLFEPLSCGSGQGIGLGLVKRIIELYGGTIWAESDGPGTGTAVIWSVVK